MRERARLSVRKAKKGFEVKILFENGKSMPAPQYEINESFNEKECEVERDKGKIIDVWVEGKPLPQKSAPKPPDRPGGRAGSPGRPYQPPGRQEAPRGGGDRGLLSNLRRKIPGILSQTLPQREAGSVKQDRKDYGITRESLQKKALDLIQEGRWLPHVLIAQIQPDIVQGITSEEVKQLDFMLKGLFRLACISCERAQEFRRLLGTNKTKYWHDWQRVCEQRLRMEPAKCLDRDSDSSILEDDYVPDTDRSPWAICWESNIYFKLMDGTALQNFCQLNNIQVQGVENTHYYAILNIRDNTLHTKQKFSALVAEVISHARDLFAHVLYDRPVAFQPLSQWREEYSLIIANSLVRMNQQYAKEMLNLSFAATDRGAVRRNLTNPQERFVQEVLTNVYNYNEGMIKTGQRGISDAYAFQIFEFAEEDGQRQARRCLLIDNIRGVFRRACSYLDVEQADIIFEKGNIDFYFGEHQSILIYGPNEHYDCNGYYANQIGRRFDDGNWRLNALSPNFKEAMKIRGIGRKETRLFIELIPQEAAYQNLLYKAIQLINLGFFRIGGIKSRGFGMLEIR